MPVRIFGKKWIVIVMLLPLIPLCLAMGGNSANVSPERIPIPAKKYQAIFIDLSDIVTEARDVSIEGATYLEGKKGEGAFTIPFDRIQSATFLMNDGKLNVMIKLRDGATLQLTVAKNKKVFGRTPYGTFQISLGDLKKMTITGPGK
ncbi:MAG: hypothetical protein CSYNP_01356 [Syntrophus sp. SKADARSKE-3]|nr:hypothetical protein [Syntrophus sp. SKADARSKE-3]